MARQSNLFVHIWGRGDRGSRRNVRTWGKLSYLVRPATTQTKRSLRLTSTDPSSPSKTITPAASITWELSAYMTNLFFANSAVALNGRGPIFDIIYMLDRRNVRYNIACPQISRHTQYVRCSAFGARHLAVFCRPRDVLYPEFFLAAAAP